MKEVKMKPMLAAEFSITFDTLENSIDRHPIIVFASTMSEINGNGKRIYYDQYSYVKARSAYYMKNKKRIRKEKHKGEIFTPASKDGLLYKDSYIDTTKIYHIKESDLDKYLKNYSVSEIHSLEPKIGLELYETLLKNARKKPPYYAVINVQWNNENQKFQAYTQYAHKNLLNKDLKEELTLNELSKQTTLYKKIIEKRNEEFEKYHHNIEAGIYGERKYYINDFKKELREIFEKRENEYLKAQKEIDTKKDKEPEMEM